MANIVIEQHPIKLEIIISIVSQFKKRGETIGMNDQQIEVKKSLRANKKLFTQLFGIGIICLFILHYVYGFIQTPDKLLENAIQRGMSATSVKAGYAFGIFCIFALPIPMAVSFLSLLIKSKRTLSSFIKILFYSLVLTFIASIVVGLVCVPRAVQQINFNTL